MEQRMNQARRKLRNWEQKQLFRDTIYQYAIVGLDMQTPGILNGVARKAKRGRVDAAKLVLELTGRHVTKGEVTAPNIVVQIGGLPRPAPKQISDAEIVGELPEDVEIDE
jgi:EAL domain-containing protein (putative c-di-GMP-specific phosphodiesterase class I)